MAEVDIGSAVQNHAVLKGKIHKPPFIRAFIRLAQCRTGIKTSEFQRNMIFVKQRVYACLLYTSPVAASMRNSFAGAS